MAAVDHQRAILLFDGVCNLCAAAVRFIVARDPGARLGLAALESEVGRLLLQRVGLDPEERSSLVLVQGRKAFRRSEAALRAAGYLRWPWPLLGVLRLVPRWLRDPLYDAIARRRYRWFGRRATCLVPSPHLERHFVARGDLELEVEPCTA